MVPKEPGAEKVKQPVNLEHGTTEKEVQEVVNVRDEEKAASAKAEKTATAAIPEEKAAKIERLKSGFRICKPQGTFLWPNMARNNTVTATTSSSNMASPQVVVQVEDLFVVPTPPSVSSSTGLVPPQLPYHPNNTNNNICPASPVKPLAERCAVTVTVSTLSNDKGDNSYSTTTTTTSRKNKQSSINLNDIPSNPIVGFWGNPLPLVMPRVSTIIYCQSVLISSESIAVKKWLIYWLNL